MQIVYIFKYLILYYETVSPPQLISHLFLSILCFNIHTFLYTFRDSFSLSLTQKLIPFPSKQHINVFGPNGHL